MAHESERAQNIFFAGKNVFSFGIRQRITRGRSDDGHVTINYTVSRYL
jgi:hypothetical protein